MSKKRSLGNLITILIACCAIFFSCERQKVEPIGKPDPNSPMMVFEGISSLYSQNAVIRLKIEAPRQVQYQNRDEGYPNGLYVEVYDSAGVRTTTVVADSGYHRLSDNAYRVMGNVVVINLVKNEKLETDVLNWDMTKQEIYTDSLTAVKITTPSRVIDGEGMRARQDFTDWEIGNVTGWLDVN